MIPNALTLESKKGNGCTKKSPVDIERIIIDHERYAIESDAPLGRGSWGVVYPGIDIITAEPVAIKIIDPNEIAQMQMQQREIDTIKAVKKETLRLAPCAHIVPRQMEIDKNKDPSDSMQRVGGDAIKPLNLENIHDCTDQMSPRSRSDTQPQSTSPRIYISPRKRSAPSHLHAVNSLSSPSIQQESSVSSRDQLSPHK